MTELETFLRQIRMLLWFSVGVLIAAIPIFAHAASIPATLVDWRVAGTAAYSGGTPLASCKAYQPAYCASCIDSVVSGETKTTAYCDFKYSSGSWMGAGVATTATYTCPDGWTKNITSSAATCTHSDPVCTEPQVMNPTSGACELPCPAAGTSLGSSSSTYSGEGQLGGSTVCISSCAVVGSCASFKTPAGAWQWGCAGPFTATGESCMGTATAVPASDPKTTCIEQGKGFGEINGVVVCTTPSSTTTTKTNTTTPSSGPASTTSVTNNTTCTGDGSCSTTTTTTTTSGGSGPGGTGPGSTTASTTSKTDEPKSTFCQENPSASVCSDICETSPDLLQCKTLGEPQSGDPVEEQNKNVSSITPTTGGAGSCPASVTLPRGARFEFTPMCNFASGIRPVVIAIAWLIAGGIMFAYFRS